MKIVLLTLILVLTGCAYPSPQKGGTSRTKSATGFEAVVSQPENPKDTTSQQVKTKRKRSFVVPAGTVYTPSPNPTNEPPAPAFTFMEPVAVEEVIEDEVSTNVGGTWKDTARELAGKFKAMAPVLWVSILMLTIVPLACWKLGWPTIAIKSMAIGLLGVLVYYLLPVYGSVIAVIMVVVFLVGGGALAYGWYRGNLAEKEIK